MPLEKSLAFNQLKQQTLTVRAIFEAIKDSHFVFALVFLFLIGVGYPPFHDISGIAIQEKWRLLMIMAAILGLTIQMILPVVSAFLPQALLKIGGGSIILDALGERAADHLIAVCGVEDVPIGVILVLPLSPLILFEYGVSAFCLIQIMFILSTEILMFTSNSKRVEEKLEGSRKWFEKERSNGVSVEDFSEWLTEKYQEYWVPLGVVFSMAILSPQNGLGSLWILWMPAFLQTYYYLTVYDLFSGGIVGHITQQLTEWNNWTKRYIR